MDKQVKNTTKSIFLVTAGVVLFFVTCFALAVVVFPARDTGTYEAYVDRDSVKGAY
ncbi:MAG: hypothetical protein K2Z81_10565 [Cyanobacteria bacterium]|nr:hypothetical protein [Cyanobacteriota bacterium]